MCRKPCARAGGGVRARQAGHCACSRLEGHNAEIPLPAARRESDRVGPDPRLPCPLRRDDPTDGRSASRARSAAPMAANFARAAWKAGSRNLDAGEIVQQLIAVEEQQRRTDRQRRLHGHGRAAREPDEPQARDPDHQPAVGARDRRAPHHRLHERPRAADPANWPTIPRNFASRSHSTARPTKCAARSCRSIASIR